jgi:putative hydrolase of HD superfamily
MKDLNKLIDFVRFTHEIRKVQRAIILDGKKIENDAEHSYQLALLAWFIIEQDNLKLDKYKCVAMALVHDVVEAYTGDVIAFASKEELVLKAKNEKEALGQLQIDWPGFTSLHELLSEYEERETEESKFVYALDKLVPIINNYLYEGKIWKKLGISLEQIKAVKKGKVDAYSWINEYYEEIIKILEQKPELFGVKK